MKADCFLAGVLAGILSLPPSCIQNRSLEARTLELTQSSTSQPASKPSSQQALQPTSRQASQLTSQPTSLPASRPEKKEFVYESLREVFIRKFLRNYLDNVTPKSDNFQKLERKYGKEELLEQYASAHELCLNLAYENRGRKITEEMYAELGKKLAEKQQETSKGVSPVNNLEENVVRIYIKWGKAKTELFVKLFEAANVIKPEKDAKEYALRLIRAAYTTKEDYQKYAQNFCSITDELYDAMKRTLGIGGLFAGEQFSRIAECTRQAYLKSVDEYFQERKNK